MYKDQSILMTFYIQNQKKKKKWIKLVIYIMKLIA